MNLFQQLVLSVKVRLWLVAMILMLFLSSFIWTAGASMMTSPSTPNLVVGFLIFLVWFILLVPTITYRLFKWAFKDINF